VVSVPSQRATYLAASSINQLRNWGEMPVLAIAPTEDVCASLHVLLIPGVKLPCLWLEVLVQKVNMVRSKMGSCVSDGRTPMLPCVRCYINNAMLFKLGGHLTDTGTLLD
jgi:hypothetical protein